MSSERVTFRRYTIQEIRAEHRHRRAEREKAGGVTNKNKKKNTNIEVYILETNYIIHPSYTLYRKNIKVLQLKMKIKKVQ